MKDFNCA